MPHPLWIVLCFAAAVVVLLLDWMLRHLEDQGDREGDPVSEEAEEPVFEDGVELAVQPAREILAALAPAEVAAVRKAAAPPLAPASPPAAAFPPTAAFPPAPPRGGAGDWLARLQATWPASRGLRAFAEAFLQEVREREPVDAAALWIEAREASAVPALEVENGLLDPARAGETRLPALFRPWRDALWSGETVCIPDTASEPDLCGRVRLSAANLLLVPFARGDRELGILAVAWNRPAEAGAEALALARRLAEAASGALARLAPVREAVAEASQDTVLTRVAAALRRAGDLEGTLGAMLEAVCHGFGYRNGAVLLVDREAGQLFVASQIGYPERVDRLRLDLAGPSVTATAARERRIVHVPDVRQWTGYVEGDPEVRSEIALPLVADGELLGILDVESVEENAFEGTVRAVLEAAADETALVLTRARLLSGLKERTEQLQAADRVARAIAGSIEPKVVLETLVREVRRAVDVEGALILRRAGRDAAWTPVAAAWRGPESTPSPLPADSEAEREATGATHGGAFAETAAAHTAFARWCAGAGWHSVYWLPVALEGEPVGLFLAVTRGADVLGSERLATLEALAPHVGAAIKNAHLYEQLELSYRRLSEARAEDVRSEQLRILGEMTSGLAHKFNNMLGVVLGRVQTGLARTSDQALQRDLLIVEKAAHEGAVAIRQLQQFTGTRGERAARPVNLAELARRVAERAIRGWRPDDGPGHATHRSAISLPADAWVLGVPEELEEVVQHLVDNAVEAMPEGGTLGVRAERREGTWSLEVSDSGPGMGEEAKSRLFHPFVTTKGPRKLGLGLSIAYAIVARHNGWIDVESESEQGTTLRVTLPTSEAPPEPEGGGRAMARPSRVLVVDDEPAVADVLAEMLASSGYETAVAHSSTEAVERLAVEPFDAVLTDLGMPGLTGWDLALHCRHLHPGTPVILVTGWGLEVDERRVAETGVFAVLAKPVEMPAMLEVVGRAIARPAKRAA